jgi:hypothetical protein
MHADLKRLAARLSALPGYEPPAGGWQAVLAAKARRGSRRGPGWPVAIAAAALVAVAGLGAWLQAAPRARPAGPAEEAAAFAVAAGARAENERLERILAALPERSVMRGSTAFTVAELEDRLILVDDRLSRLALEPHAPERAEALWRERADVMHSLVQVRYADAVGSY